MAERFRQGSGDQGPAAFKDPTPLPFLKLFASSDSAGPWFTNYDVALRFFKVYREAIF